MQLNIDLGMLVILSFIALMALKLTNIIYVSWLIVFAPIWIFLIGYFAVIIIALFILFIKD